MKNKAILATAVATAVGGVSGAADAATVNATLTQVLVYGNQATAGSVGNITSSTATFSYDTDTGLLSQTGGTFNMRQTTSPTTTLFRTFITGLVMGNGGAASAATYSCTEGNFGTNVGASICGNYNLGANFANESTTTWGPGTAISRTIGGDDIELGPQQSIASLDGMSTISWVGTSLILANKTCTGACLTTVGGFNNGQQWTLNAVNAVVPIPATAWLLGTGLLGVAGRKFLRKKA